MKVGRASAFRRNEATSYLPEMGTTRPDSQTRFELQFDLCLLVIYETQSRFASRYEKANALAMPCDSKDRLYPAYDVHEIKGKRHTRPERKIDF